MPPYHVIILIVIQNCPSLCYIKLLDVDPQDQGEEDGAVVDLDSQRKGKCAVIKTSTRQVRNWQMCKKNCETVETVLHTRALQHFSLVCSTAVMLTYVHTTVVHFSVFHAF